MPIPSPLHEAFEVATTGEIKSWSFGALQFRRHHSATSRDNVKGTLYDQRIFGPVNDFKCACGKYAGNRYAELICDRCGVKVTTRSARATRFGHVDFVEPIAHPFAQDSCLRCFPVLPAIFIESRMGQHLQDLYDRLIETAAKHERPQLAVAVASLVDYLVPAVTAAYNWNLTDCKTLGRGLALRSRACPG